MAIQYATIDGKCGGLSDNARRSAKSEWKTALGDAPQPGAEYPIYTRATRSEPSSGKLGIVRGCRRQRLRPGQPPLTEIKPITPEEIKSYKEQHQWLENPAYQPQDHEQACKALVIANPNLPRIDGLRGSITLKFYQPVAIHALVRIKDSTVDGGILAEEMGLGKTVEMIGLLLHRSNQRRAARAKKLKMPKAKPTLILMTKILINQLKDEILAFTDRFTVVIYYGSCKKSKEKGVIYHKGKLTQSSSYFSEECWWLNDGVV